MADIGTNTFKAQCFRCGGEVEPQQGLLSFSDGSHGQHWKEFRGRRRLPLVQHRECEVEHRGTYHHFKYKDLLA